MQTLVATYKSVDSDVDIDVRGDSLYTIVILIFNAEQFNQQKKRHSFVMSIKFLICPCYIVGYSFDKKNN